MKRVLTVLGIIGAVMLCLAIWGLVEPRILLDVREEEAIVPGLPEAWEGRTVALLADLQVGMWLDNTDMVRRTVRRAVALNPALILIAGDFVYHADSAVVRQAVDLVRPLSDSDTRVVAVLGNHDYSLSGPEDDPRGDLADYLVAQLASAGVTVLENESTSIEGLHVVGIGSDWAGRARPAVALGGVPAGSPRIVFMHNPISFREIPAHDAPLALAGHTHGGQIRVPMTPSESWLHIARQREVIADGWGEDGIGAEGNRLYVNRGLGFSLLPIRIRCRPELTILTLRAPAHSSNVNTSRSTSRRPPAWAAAPPAIQSRPS